MTAAMAVLGGGDLGDLECGHGDGGHDDVYN